MELRIAELEDNKLCVAFIGDLNNVAVADAEQSLARVFERDDCDILIECAKLNYISSMGLRLLLKLHKHARSSGHKTYIRNMNDFVRQVLQGGGFLDLFKEA